MPEVQPHGKLVLADLGFVAAMRPGTSIEERRGMAKGIAAWTFDVNDFRAELAQLRADVGLRDQHAGAYDTNAFEGPKFWDQCRRWGPFKMPDPVGHLGT